MKKVVIVFGLLFLFAQINIANKLQQEEVAAEIKFDKTTHDFGEIKKNARNVKCIFTFTNTGNDMLSITKIVNPCGSTVAAYSKKPIMPGQTSEIEVGYANNGIVGVFNKKITVFTNAITESVILTIKGEVKK